MGRGLTIYEEYILSVKHCNVSAVGLDESPARALSLGDQASQIEIGDWQYEFGDSVFGPPSCFGVGFSLKMKKVGYPCFRS